MWTIEEAAAVVGVTYSTVFWHVRNGSLSAVKVRGHWYINPEDLKSVHWEYARPFRHGRLIRELETARAYKAGQQHCQ